MKRIFLLALGALALAGSVKADDDDATIRTYLHDSGYNNLSDADLAKVHAYLKATGHKHIGEADVSIALNGPAPALTSSAPISARLKAQSHINELLQRGFSTDQIYRMSSEGVALGEQIDTLSIQRCSRR